MSAGIATTWELLTTTANEAADAALVPALDSPWRQIRDNALNALLQRREPAGHLAILQRLHEFDSRWREIVYEHRHGLAKAVRNAAIHTDPQTCANGCEALVWFREHALLPVLLNAAEAAQNPLRDVHLAAIVRLSQELYEELHLPRDKRHLREPDRARGEALNFLESSVARFSQHGRKEVIEAFLVLATRENHLLKNILANPAHGSHFATVELLLHSEQPGIVRLVLSALTDPRPSAGLLSILGRRQSPGFISHLLKAIGREPSAVAAANLRKIENIGWTRPEVGIISKLSDAEQHSLVKMVMLSGIKRAEAMETVEFILRNGQPDGRQAAAEALAEFSGARVGRLGMAALKDSDPLVQAAAVKQLRARGGPGVLSRLIEMADSPHAAVKNAVREALTEFRFGRFLTVFDTLDESVRRSTGAIVRKVDHQTIPMLAAELQSPIRTRRLRAIAVAMAIEAAPEIEPHLCEAVLRDTDHMVRAEAARALGECNTAAAVAALVEAACDQSLSVREAAERSLDEMKARGAAVHRSAPPEGSPHD